MKFMRFLVLCGILMSAAAAVGFAQRQGPDMMPPNTSKTDWEEINFEFNSAVLSDGFPSLLRLAELLQKNPNARIRVVGHTDIIGNNRANDRLGERRAEAVKNFLVKYGANPNQIETASRGERPPTIPGQRNRYSRTDVPRWMARRVTIEVISGDLKDGAPPVPAGPQIGDVIRLLEKHIDESSKCCSEILARLDKLTQMLEKYAQDHEALRKELAELRSGQQAVQKRVEVLPDQQQVSTIVDARTAEQIERARIPRYNILNLNVGADSNRDLTFTGRGRFFAPFKERFAFQAQAEYMYFRDRKEGQIDFGLLNRFASRAQAGLFASFKHVLFSGQRTDPLRNIFGQELAVSRDPVRGNGTLGQGSVVLDYIFSRGRLGVFGSKGFMNTAVLNRVTLFSPNVVQEYYLSTLDQVGVSTTLGLMGNTYLEGNLGYLKSRAHADRPGGTLRFVFPITDRVAFTVEGGMNETLLERSHNGRAVVGLQFGNFMRPKDYLEGYNGIQHAVPADVPRVRYELLTRRVRTGGNQPPVADAGPDQIGVPAGTITLDGSGSYDPDGDPITFEWSQVAGPPVSISGMNQARATFTAAEGQTYSFRLTVRDDRGAQTIARVTVSTSQQQPVQIVRFQASPSVIRAGQTSTIDWQVLNADTVTITQIGSVDPRNGTRTVSPTGTTQYRLTARNRVSEVSATTTIVVEEQPRPQFLACTVTPVNILAGESATISFSTANADSVTITGIGPVGQSGAQVVTPAQTTTYTLTATGPGGTSTCTLTVQVTRGEAPRIVSFTADPLQIQGGQSSTLRWNVENATEVTITGLGTVQNAGSAQVSPAQTTSYTLTARNQFGSVSSSVLITVTTPPGPPAPTITGCSASPSGSVTPGTAVQLLYTTANAQSVTITPNPGGAIPLQGPVTVRPTQSTNYTITAVGAAASASCTVSVAVVLPPPPTAVILGPQVIETYERFITLDGSNSVSPTGSQLTFIWEPLGTGAAVLDQGQARTRIQIGGQYGDYIIRLRVRDQFGQEGTTTVTVRFFSTRIL